MANDKDRRPDIGGAAAMILVALLLGILVLAGGGFFYWQTTEAKRQELMARDAAMAAEVAVRQAESELVKQRNQPPAEADPNDMEPNTAQQISIEIDDEGNASIDGKSIQLDALLNTLRTISGESRGQLSAVIQVAHDCRFEDVARILSLCEESGIESPRLISSDN